MRSYCPSARLSSLYLSPIGKARQASRIVIEGSYLLLFYGLLPGLSKQLQHAGFFCASYGSAHRHCAEKPHVKPPDPLHQ
jgi:hypothetical protein